MGNRDRADDGVGLIIGDELAKYYPNKVFSNEEDDISVFLLQIIDNENLEHVVLIDAADFDSKPGSILLTSTVNSKVKSISTHSIPYNQIELILKERKKDFTLIGIQAKSLEFMGEITKEVLKASKNVIDLFALRK